MARIRVIHWKESEAGPLLDACRACGHEADYAGSEGVAAVRRIRTDLPDAVVIDLTRMPSHGRELGLAIRGRKYTRGIPLVYVDGEAEKVEGIRKLLPDATYTSRKQLCARLKSALAKKAMPMAPPTVAERYGTRTKAQKLGIAAGSKVALFDAPRDYAAALGEMPDGVEFLEDPEETCPVTLWFVYDPGDYQDGLRDKRKIAGKTKLWIVWPKGAKNGLNGNLVREAANEVGLVDYKICAVSERWSGMVFAPRRK